jgi:hypothetical protein
MQRSDSIVKIAGALLKAQKSMGDAVKDSKNPFFKSSYADLNAIREVATPAMNAQGITILQPTVMQGGKNYVNTVLLHESGEYLGSLTEIKNLDGKPQSEGSGISYARRYSLQSLLNIGAVDDDGEAAMGRQFVTKPEVKHDKKEINTAPESKASSGQVDTKSSKTDIKTDTKVLRQKIKSAFSVLEAQKKITKEVFIKDYLSGGKVDEVSDNQINIAITKLKLNFTELSL